MFRQSFRRMGHQLIHEPMGNEHDTLSRGRRTVSNLSSFTASYAGVAAAGVAMMGYVVVTTPEPVATVSANGTLVKK